jgi:hypothetical protein
MLHYVVCKECSYPLSAIVAVGDCEKDEILYYKNIIDDYQNGVFAKKEDMLNWIKDKYERGRIKNQEIVDICDKFLIK